MKKIISVLILTTIFNLVSGQTNYEKFKKLFADKDTTKTKLLLAEWEKSNPNDPECCKFISINVIKVKKIFTVLKK